MLFGWESPLLQSSVLDLKPEPSSRTVWPAPRPLPLALCSLCKTLLLLLLSVLGCTLGEEEEARDTQAACGPDCRGPGLGTAVTKEALRSLVLMRLSSPVLRVVDPWGV
jgi:hypothetical protein